MLHLDIKQNVCWVESNVFPKNTTAGGGGGGANLDKA